MRADDYVTKPFPIRVFRKKVSALLALIQKQTGGDWYTDGTLSINFLELTATLAGEPSIFTPMEYRLLKVLVRNPQIVLTRQVLLEKLWDADENFVDEHALTVAISRIRGNEVMRENRESVAKERADLQKLISDISHQVKMPFSNRKMVNATLLEQPMPEEKQRHFT